MSTLLNGAVVHKTVLINPLRSRKQFCLIIKYQKIKYIATITVESGKFDSISFGNNFRGDKLLNLHLTSKSPRKAVHFKMEIEDSDKNVGVLLFEKWQNKDYGEICNLSELSRQHPNQFINNGRDLTLSITLGTLNQLIEPKVEKKFSTLNSLKVMLDQGILTDVILKTKKEKFRCHKVILAASSEVFRAMFVVDMQESQTSEVDFTGVYDAGTIRDVLHFMYTNQSPPDIAKNAMSLLVAADYFQLADLKELCSVVLCRDITVKTAANLLQLAEKHNVDYLKTKVVDFIMENYESVMATSGYSEIPEQMTKHLLSTFLRTIGSKQNQMF